MVDEADTDERMSRVGDRRELDLPIACRSTDERLMPADEPGIVFSKIKRGTGRRRSFSQRLFDFRGQSIGPRLNTDPLEVAFGNLFRDASHS